MTFLYNTTAASSGRDGAIWQGRGATVAATGGISLEHSIFRLEVRPMIVATQNVAFQPAGSQRPPGDFRDPEWGASIDRPYRFGPRAFVRIFAGESTLRADYNALGAGVTAASQHWGPATYYPLLIGTEGPGYPRVFLEARNLTTPIGRMTAHWQLGFLEASEWSGLGPDQRSRTASAFMGSYSPRGITQLTIGGGRFFHVRRESRSVTLNDALLPFSGLVKTRSPDAQVGGYNQLASAMFSVAPGAGIEVYGELLRDDHNWDSRDLIGEPDHSSAFVLGVRKARATGDNLETFTVERANGRYSHLARLRGQAPAYTHSAVVEGHTYVGEPLGAGAVLGGGGLQVSVERAGPTTARELAIEIRPRRQNTEGGTWNGQQSGSIVLRLGTRVLRRHGLFEFVLQTSIGYGDGAKSNAAVGTRWSR